MIGNFMSLVIDQPIFNLLQKYLGIKKRSPVRIDSKVPSKVHLNGGDARKETKMNDKMNAKAKVIQGNENAELKMRKLHS